MMKIYLKYLNAFNYYSLSKKIFFCVIIFFGFFILFFILIENSNHTLKELNTINVKIYQLKNNLFLKKISLNNTSSTYKLFKNILPLEFFKFKHSFLKEISIQSGKFHILLNKISITKKSNSQQTVDINFSGKYQNIRNFFEKIIDSKYMLDIHSFEWIANNSDNLLSGHIMIILHLNNKIMPLHKILWPHFLNLSNRNPFLLTSKHVFSEYLIDSIYRFKMVGFMRENNNFIGLIKNLKGKVFYVKVGDYIGMENAKVINISRDGISLTVQSQNREYVIE